MNPLHRPVILSLLAVSLAAGAAESQGLPPTVDPAMIRGAAKAPVTIVEFSDYQ